MSRGKYWVTEPDQVIEPKIAASGFGSIAPKTVIQVMQTTVEKHGNADAMAYKKAGEVLSYSVLVLCPSSLTLTVTVDVGYMDQNLMDSIPQKLPLFCQDFNPFEN